MSQKRPTTPKVWLGNFVLDGHEPVPCEDLLTWAKWLETAERHVALTELPDGVRVSTVFLGIDHSFGIMPGPILFETMVFGGPFDLDQERYRTWDEAEAGHAEMVAKVTGGRHA